jgi:hypothetical protein
MVRQMSSTVGGPACAARTGADGFGGVVSRCRTAKVGSVDACDDACDDASDEDCAVTAAREAPASVGSVVMGLEAKVGSAEGSAASEDADGTGDGDADGIALVCACAPALQQTKPQISNGPANLIMRTKRFVFVSDKSCSLPEHGRRQNLQPG